MSESVQEIVDEIIVVDTGAPTIPGRLPEDTPNRFMILPEG